MNLLIIGATGALGGCLVEAARRRGHNVTALVHSRQPVNLAPDVARVQGSLLHRESLRLALQGQQAVLVAVAPRLRFRGQTRVFSEGVAHLTCLMEQLGPKRLLWTTSAGVEPAYVATGPWFYRRILHPWFLAGIYADCAASEQYLEQTPLQWTVVRPSRLTNGSAGERVVAASVLPAAARSISRADVAEFMVGELEQQAWVGQKLMLADGGAVRPGS